MNEIKHWICLAQDSVNSPKSVWGFLFLIRAPHQLYVRWGGGGKQLQAFSTSTLDKSEWSASRPGHFTPDGNSTSNVQSSVPCFDSTPQGAPQQATDFLTRSVTSSLSRRTPNVVGPDVCQLISRHAHARTHARTHTLHYLSTL
jgi:hypothetical protein